MALTNGFIKNEAQTLLNLCIQLNGTGTDEPIPKPPAGWKKIFDGHYKNTGEKEASLKIKSEKQDGLGPFDNAWEFWRKAESNQYAVVVRGTVENFGSIMDDVLATTLKSDGFLEVGPQKKRLPLRFAPVEDGAIHLGFTWGAAILTFHKEKGILRELLNIPNNSEIYITGHSQGAAIATLLHALLYYAGQAGTDTPFGVAMRAKQLSFKSYVFAQPKPANWQFCQDFAQIAGNQGWAICLNNSRDWVPQVPFAFGLIDDITANPIPAFLDSKGFWGKLAAGLLIKIGQSLRWLRKMIGEAVSDSAKRAQKYLFEHIDTGYLSNQSGGDNASASINYNQCGQLISLQGHVEPQEKTDGFWQHHLAVYQRLMDEQLPARLP
jgi:hypothetical protein